MFCPQCQSEYVDGITECVDCHVPLVAELQSETLPNYEDFQVIRTYANRYDAELGKSVLEANGIETLIAADDAGGTVLGLELAEGVKLLVRAEELDNAEEIFKDLESLPAEDAIPASDADGTPNKAA